MAHVTNEKMDFLEKKGLKSLYRYEKVFSTHKYKGTGPKYFRRIKGTTEVVFVAPFSVKHQTTLSKYSGGLARLLSKETACQSIVASKVFQERDKAKAVEYYNSLINSQETQVIIELRTHKSYNDDVSIFSYGENKDFFERLALYTIQYNFKDGNDIKIEITKEMTTMMAQLFQPATSQPSLPHTLIIDVSEHFFEKDNVVSFKNIVHAIRDIVALLNCMDWAADKYYIYRLWQSNTQMPQDKVEFINSKYFKENALIHICSPVGLQETARINEIKGDTVWNEIKSLNNATENKGGDYVVLTNRLIEMLFCREWIEGVEELPGLRGAPVIIYENNSEQYEIGIPKAVQVNSIALSTALFEEKCQLSSKYDFLAFNSFSDSRIFIEVEKSDYKDNGRVKDSKGTPNAKKVMMPRYYRLMMGYMEKPLSTIRAEKYYDILSNISVTSKNLSNEITEEDFNRCYKKIQGHPYYQLVEESEVASDEKEKYRKSIENISKYLEKIGAYKYVNLIRIPKTNKTKKTIIERLYCIREKTKFRVLKKLIGKSEYILKTSWAAETDDKNNVARLNGNMMSLIGVSENDKILIRFGENVITLRVLQNDDLSDYEIGIPSSGRRDLRMNSVNDIVVVHRDMVHTFKRHSQEQTIAILGTVLAVVQVLTAFKVFTDSLWGIMVAIVVCIVAIVLMLYFALSEERVKVK